MHDYFLDLEQSLSKDVSVAKELILTPLPDKTVQLTTEELEVELLKLSAMHHISAKLKAKGYGLHEIVRYLRTKYHIDTTEVQVSYMIQKVLNLNYRMMPKSTELLKQQVEEQLDDLILGAYKTAEEEGRTYLKPAESKLVLSVLDRRIRLHGLDAPVIVETTTPEAIKQFQDDLYSKLDNVLRKSGAIEATKVGSVNKEETSE